MTVESATYISQLNSANPTGADAKSEGDDHLRLLKSTLLTTFPGITGAMTATHTQLNKVVSTLSIASAPSNALSIDVSGNAAFGSASTLDVNGTKTTKTYTSTGDTTVSTVPVSSGLGGGLYVVRGFNGLSGASFVRIYAVAIPVSGGSGSPLSTLIGSAGGTAETFVFGTSGGNLTITSSSLSGGSWAASQFAL